MTDNDMNMRRLRATPFVVVLEPPNQGDDIYPDGHWVRASTDLIFPSKALYPDENVDDDIYCELHSPSEMAGGRSGISQEDAFHKAGLVLSRMLTFMGILIAETP